ncbi:MAG: DNA polymerase III subunit gamma/tau [Myxococcales bacterium]|nr:DNA polymerase III subunit gamma/tau [Myxococcales bacterium]
MSDGYLAIARKWRPHTLEEMAGQSHVTRTLGNALASGRLHHAFLFTGARGVGKTTAARAFARSLNCVEGASLQPCGQCAPCREIPLGTSPDVIEVDGASNNSVEDVRDLRDGIRYLPNAARFKIYIIDEVHMLSKGAFNALLKTLEEPPPHVKFIFATTEANKIPDTILSRVQRFDFKRIPQPVVAERLRLICEAEGVEISDGSLRMIARAGEGSMRDSQSLLDQVISFGGMAPTDVQVVDILGLVDRRMLYDMLEGMLGSDAPRCLDAIAEVYERGYEIGQFTSELLELVRDAALVALSATAVRHMDAPEEERERLGRVAAGVPAEQLARTFHVLLEVHDQVARASRPRMVLEMAVARLVAIRPAEAVGPLVERLADLERRLRGAGATPPRPRGREPGDDPEGERRG